MKAGMLGGAGAMALAGAGLLFGADDSIPDIELQVTPTEKRIVIDPATPEIPTHLEIEYTLTNRGNQEASIYDGPGALVLERGHDPWLLRPGSDKNREAGVDNRVRLASGESIERVTRFKLEHKISKKAKLQYVLISNHDDSMPQLEPGATSKFVFRYVDPLRADDWWKYLVISTPVHLSVSHRDREDFDSPLVIAVENKAVPKIGFTLAPAKIEVAVPPRSKQKRPHLLRSDTGVVTVEYTITNHGTKPIIVNRGYESTFPILIGPTGELMSQGMGADHFRRASPNDFATLDPGQSVTETANFSFFRSRETPGIFFSHENRSGSVFGNHNDKALASGRYHLAFWYSPPSNHEDWEMHQAKKPPPADWWKGVKISNYIELNLSLANAEDES